MLFKKYGPLKICPMQGIDGAFACSRPFLLRFLHARMNFICGQI